MSKEGKSPKAKELIEPIRKSPNSSITTIEPGRSSHLRKMNSKAQESDSSAKPSLTENIKDFKTKSPDNLLTDNKIVTMTEFIDPNKKEGDIKVGEKILTLEVINSSIITKGTIIQITAQGLIGSRRCVQDGNVYFGTESKGVI